MSYALGLKAWAICDRCGQRFKYTALREEWTGFKVCGECYEEEHPQENIHAPAAEAQALHQPRPEASEALIVHVGQAHVFPPVAQLSTQLIGLVGEVSVETPIDVSVSTEGLTATSGLGSVTLPNETVWLEGLSSTGDVGSPTFILGISFAATGLAASTGVGTVEAGIVANISLGSLAATGSPGAVTVVGDANVAVTGNAATATGGSVATLIDNGWANIATATPSGDTLNHSATSTSCYGARWGDNGNKLYLMVNGTIRQYAAATPYRLSGMTFTQTVTVTGIVAPRSFFLKPDGLAIWIVANGGGSQYRTLGSAWDISTMQTSATDSKAQGTGITNIVDCYWSEDGMEFYELTNNEGIIKYYTATTPYSYTGLTEQSDLDISAQMTGPRTMYFKPDGTKMFVVDGTSDDIFQYTLGTPWDVTTATYDGDTNGRYNPTATGTTCLAFTFADDGTAFLAGNFSTGIIYEYTL